MSRRMLSGKVTVKRGSITVTFIYQSIPSIRVNCVWTILVSSNKEIKKNLGKD